MNLPATYAAFLFLHVAAFAAQPPKESPFEARFSRVQQVDPLKKELPELKQPDMARATENDALALAALDLRTIPAGDANYVRYIWCPDGSLATMKIMSLTLNYISSGTVIARPVPLGKDKLMVLRVDLRAYAPSPDDLANLIKTWEEFRYDPRFNLLVTKDTVKFADGAGVKLPPLSGKVKKFREKFIEEPAFKGAGMDGKFVTKQKAIKEEYEEDVNVDVVRVPAPHLDQTLVAELIERTGSEAAVTNSSYFLFRSMSSIKDKGIFATVWGGLYYDLAGIKAGAKKGTDEDVLFESLGIGNVEKGVNFDQVFDKLRSDQAAAMWHSDVTGNQRKGVVAPTLATRDGMSIVARTLDLKKQSVDIGVRPIFNLLKFQHDASEVIFTKRNKLHGFALFNGQGVRQDEVPPDIAADSKIPPPNGNRLQCGLGCIRCHSPNSGWQPMQNDAKAILKSTDILGDLTIRNNSDSLDRLAGLYSGDLETVIFPRARDDYSQAILACTGPWPESKDQTDIARVSANKMGEIYGDYWYKTVTAADAIRDAGIAAEDGKAAHETLRKYLPPVAPLEGSPGFFLEDPRIAALTAGQAIPRTDYDLVFAPMVLRIAVAAKKGN